MDFFEGEETTAFGVSYDMLQGIGGGRDRGRVEASGDVSECWQRHMLAAVRCACWRMPVVANVKLCMLTVCVDM